MTGLDNPFTLNINLILTMSERVMVIIEGMKEERQAMVEMGE